jgi:hypothetical protein
MRRLVATMGLFAAATSGPAAWGQDALGSGGALSRDTRHAVPNRATRDNPLDANTRVGSFGLNDTAAKQDFYSRNLIVTGDVGGGRQFRGSVGYREQSEFTGQTGSDDNRAWRAYSVYSSPYMGQAAYNPLRASQEFGAIMYTRTYSGASARDLLTDQQPLDARIAFDRFTADGTKMKRQADIIDPGNVRDTSARIDWRRTRQSSEKDRDTRWRGIPVDDLVGSLGLTAYDRQRLKADILAGRTQREWIGDPFQDTSLLPGASLVDSARVRATLAPEYGAILDTLRQRAGDRIPTAATPAEPAAREKAATDRLNTDLEWLRGELMRSGVEGGTRKDSGQGTQGPRQSSTARPEGTAPLGPDGKPLLGPDGKPVEPAKGTDGGRAGDADRAPTPNIDELAYILRHGKKLQSLVPEDSSAIRDMMDLGATCMRRGEFFRAEERFNTVLQVVPNSALALAGVANSQLGAGLYVSSALSLRKLFAMHPEMIGTRLGSEVIPSDDRLAAALAAARERLAGANLPTASAATKSDRFEFGLLIAYVGFQTDKADAVTEGLDAMRTAKPGDALPELLQRVWGPGAAPAAPAAPPAAAAPAADPTRPTSPSVR